MNRYQLGDALIDERNRTVVIDGDTRTLTDLTWKFLLALMQSAPDAVGQAELAKIVWNADHVSDETIAQRVRQLRQVFSDDPKAPTYIRTIRGGGYQLIPTIKRLSKPEKSYPSLKISKQVIMLSVGILVASLIGLAIVATSPQQELRSNQLPSTAPDVAELVSRAHEYRRRGQYASNQHAIELYEQALDLDPDNVGGLIGLSYSLSHKPSRYEESSDWATRAADLADRALLIDSSNADAWAARGLADDARGRVSNAIGYYRKALDLDPGNADLRASIAYLLQVQGKLHEALTLEIEALSKAPPTYFADYQISITLKKAGFASEASKWLKRAEQLRPDNVYLLEHKARSLIASGHLSEAQTLLETANASRVAHAVLNGTASMLNGQEADALKAFSTGQNLAEAKKIDCYPCLAALSASGDTRIMQKIDQILAHAPEAIRNGEEWPGYRVELAYLFAARNEAVQAQTALEDAFELGYLDRDWLLTSPLLSTLQDTRSFETLLLRMDEHQAEQRQLIENDPALSALIRD